MAGENEELGTSAGDASVTTFDRAGFFERQRQGLCKDTSTAPLPLPSDVFLFPAEKKCLTELSGFLFFQDELMAKNMRELEDLTSKLQSAHQSEMDRLKQQYEGKTFEHNQTLRTEFS